MDSSGGDSVEWSEVFTWRCNDDDGGAKASVLGARWERARVSMMKLRELIAIMVTRRVDRNAGKKYPQYKRLWER